MTESRCCAGNEFYLISLSVPSWSEHVVLNGFFQNVSNTRLMETKCHMIPPLLPCVVGFVSV